MGKKIQSIKDYISRTSPPWLLKYLKLIYSYYYNIRYEVIRNHYYVFRIKKYYSNPNRSNSEIDGIIEVISKYGIMTIPYEWAVETDVSSIDVFFDEKKGLHYTLLDGKKLYYPRSWDIDKIQKYFNSIQIIEQNEKSPHRYLTSEFNVDDGDIVVDCGVAEGNFSLSVIDKVKYIYIFEPDNLWIEPLNATFEPWMDKTVITQKFVSDTISESSVTLDTFFEDKEKPTFMKIDVDGYEKHVLMGSRKMLSNSFKKIVVCTYHYAKDELELGNLVKSYKFSITPSDGYMLVRGFDKFKPPYFRHGLLRCVKK